MLLELLTKIDDVTINVFIVRILIIIALLELVRGYLAYFSYSYYLKNPDNQENSVTEFEVKSFFVGSFILTGLLLCYFLFKIKTV